MPHNLDSSSLLMAYVLLLLIVLASWMILRSEKTGDTLRSCVMSLQSSHAAEVNANMSLLLIPCVGSYPSRSMILYSTSPKAVECGSQSASDVMVTHGSFSISSIVGHRESK